MPKPRAANLPALGGLRFEPNRGQTDPQVKFLGRGPGYTMFLSGTEAAFAIPKPVEQPVAQGLARKARRTKFADPDSDKPQPIEYSLVRMKLEGARSEATTFEAMDKLPGKINYFKGNDPKKWRTNIPIYSRVKIHNVYPGIDLVYRGGAQRQLEYDLVVAPTADPDAIKISFAGADSMRLDSSGDLHLSVGGRDFVQRAPVVYQDVGGAKRTVAAHYQLRGNHSTAIQLAAYDRAKPLVIDPALVWATYLGGTQSDQINAVATRPNNGSDTVYVTGKTASSDLAVKASPENSQLVGGDDAFVAELSHDGATIIFFSYVGGSGMDEGKGIAVDPSGNAYIVGRTFSSNFPSTIGAKDTSCCGGFSGAFVTKILFDGSNLVYSTFIRGRSNSNPNIPSGTENGRNDGTAIAVDPKGNAYVTGWTDSLNFPTKSASGGAAFQASNGGILAGRDCAQGSCINAFVTEVNGDGSDYVFSTYLGGEEFTRGLGITVQGTRPMTTAPEVYTPFVAGETTDLMFPVTPGAFQPTLNNGQGDGENTFVTEVKSDGAALLASTYLGDGGENGDEMAAIAATLDTTFPDRKMVCVTGQTFSANFPVCGVGGITCARAPSTFQSTLGTANAAAYVTCFDFDGNAFSGKGTGQGLAFSTFLGGTDPPNDNVTDGTAIQIDDCDNTYVTGFTTATNLPTTSDAPFKTLPGLGNAFVTVFDFTGASTPFSTYLGGGNTEIGRGLALDLNDNILIGGDTLSTNSSTNNFPTTPGSAQPNYGGGNDDGFLAKIATIPGGCKVDNCSVAVTVTSPGNNQGSPGQKIPAGSFTLTNSCADTIFLSNVQITLNDPGLFSSLKVTSTVHSNMSMSSVAASPAGITKFTLPNLVNLLPGDFTTIDLSATIATNPDGPSSDQVIFGSEQFDERGHTVVNSGIPKVLGKVSQGTVPTPTATATAIPTATVTATQTPAPTATPTPVTVPVPLSITVAGLRNGLVNYGNVRVGRFTKRRFTLSNVNRTHTPIQFLDGDGHGDSFVVDPAGNFGFLQGVQATNCPQPLPANRKCWLDVYFVPQDKLTNPKTANLMIYDNANNAPQRFTLTGNGK